MQQRAKGFLERMNTMTREKRGLDHAVDPEDRPQDAKKQKVPALASVIVEALKVDSLQKLCSSLEPILRRVVSEEVERALAKLGPARLGKRSSPKQIEGPDTRNLQLHFQSRFSLPIFTGGKVEGEQGAAVHVVLLDANTSHVVTSGPESSVKLDVVVLEGDFNTENDDNWTQEDFECQVVKEREGKRPLLTGDLQVSLKEGVGTLGDLTFTDNSSWVRSRKFRLGLKVASGICEGIRIREAKTDSFMVKDHRGELYKKHYPPAPDDEVWRLEKIGKDGSFHKRLNKAGIFTVEDFLRLVVRDAQRLRHVLGSGMSNKMWEVLVDHAKTCALSGKLYVYYPDDGRNVGVVFNNIYELSGLIANGQYYSAETLSDSQKVFVDTLVKKAYDNWMLVVEYDGRSLLNLKNNSGSNASQNEVPKDSAFYSAPFDQQVSQPQLPVSMPAEHASVESGLAAGGGMGYGEDATDRYKTLSQPSNDEIQFPSSAFLHNHLISPYHQIQTAANNNTAGPQPSSFTFQSVGPSIQQSNLNLYDDCFRHRDPKGVDEFFSEEEIRMRSHEMLENEDMQHMLRIFSMGGTSSNASDEVHPYSSYMPLPLPSPSLSPSPLPNYGSNEDRSRPSGKGVVGWLKIKALLRWGIFIRRQAAEKRAHLIELDD